MADYDDSQAVTEEERQTQAAALIQNKWREYRQRVAPQSGDFASGIQGEVELSPEEQREIMLDKVKGLLMERDVLLQSNMNSQRALIKLFNERRNQQDRPETQAPNPEAESKYWASVSKLHEDREALEKAQLESQRDVQVAREKHEAAINEALLYEANFIDFVKEKAAQAVFPRNGMTIPSKRIAQFESEEKEMFEQLHEARIQYIKLRNKAKKLSSQLKEKEQLTDGLHLIDFEQLKIENTNLNEKIEERNEDLLKLRKKATTTIHILTHVKEKLEFIKGENVLYQKQVTTQEEQLAQLRDKVAQLKRERDSFVTENTRMREKMPMIGSEDLLLDYELRKKEIENCRIEVVQLTNRHHELMQWIAKHQPRLESLQKATRKE